jgi:hypothetical protein
VIAVKRTQVPVGVVVRELEQLVTQLEEFVELSLRVHREYCEKVETEKYSVDKCTAQLARALLPVVRGFVNSEIYSRIVALALDYKYSVGEYYGRVERVLLKLKRAARLQ